MAGGESTPPESNCCLALTAEHARNQQRDRGEHDGHVKLNKRSKPGIAD
jgi:hypothetical protein